MWIITTMYVQYLIRYGSIRVVDCDSHTTDIPKLCSIAFYCYLQINVLIKYVAVFLHRNSFIW